MNRLDKILKAISKVIKELKLISISGLIFNSWMIYYVLEWVTNSEPASIGEGVAITGIIGALSLNYRFIFNFYTTDTKSKIDEVK